MNTNNHTLLFALLVFAILPGPTLYAAAPDKQIIADIQDAIDQQEALYGAYHPALSELHLSLGTALQQQGEHQQAVTALKQAMHLNRVDRGIKSLSQEPMIRRMITSYSALNETLLLAGSYQQLIDLYQQNYGASSEELIPLLLEAGDWHRQQYLQQTNDSVFAHLVESTNMLQLAGSISRLHFDKSSTERLPALQSIVKNYYYLARHYSRYRPKPPKGYVVQNSRFFRFRRRDEGSFDYDNAYDQYLRSQERRLAPQYQRELIQQQADIGFDTYQQVAAIYAKDGNIEQHAATLTAQGDWLLLFHRSFLSANSLYRKSWNLLNDSGNKQALQQLFAQPQLLPTFHQQNPANFSQLARIQADVNHSGQASNIKVLETVPVNSAQVARKADEQLRQLQFRSRIENGQPVDSKNVELNLFID